MASGLCIGVMVAQSATAAGTRFEIPANDESFRTRVYTGISFGNSHLDPDTSGTVFSVEGKDDLGTQLRLGVDIHNMLSMELESSVLGESTLREAGASVKYSTLSLSALVYGLNGVQLRSRREGWSAYARLGLGLMKKSSQVVPLEESGTVPILGAGAEYGFSNGLGIRGELVRLDDDAVFFGLGAVYRFGTPPSQIGQIFVEAARPVLASNRTRVAPDGRALNRQRFGGEHASGAQDSDTRILETQDSSVRVANRWSAEARPNDNDGDGVPNANDRCPGTLSAVTVNRVGCGLFDMVLVDVTFKPGSTWLTARARGALDELAQEILAFPEARIQVRAHTDSTGPADYNLALSARRAEATVLYLQSQGVSELQLEALGLGETQPIASNASAKGRKRNRRVDLRTLENMNDAMLLASSPERDRPLEGWANVRPPAYRTPRAPANRLANASDTTAGEPTTGEPTASPAPSTGNASAPSLAAARPDETPAGVSQARPQRAAALPRPGHARGFAYNGVVDGLLFPPGTSRLTADARNVVSLIATELRRRPTVRVAIMAHTDDIGEPDDNQRLSDQRAAAVMNQLIASGIKPDRMIAEGYGESLPLVQNRSPADRARNRRIELRVLR